MDKKVAITKNGIDLIRIIPLEKDDSSFEIKITPLSKRFVVKIHQLLNPTFAAGDFDFDSVEFTYHVKNEVNGTKLHAKINNNGYSTLPLTYLIDLSHDIDFPIPLFKLMLPFNYHKSREYRKKKGHIPFDVKKYNIAEVYLINKGSLVDNPLIRSQVTLHLMSTSLEFFADNFSFEDVTKTNFFKNEFTEKTQMGSTTFEINKRLKLLIIFYSDKTFNLRETYTFIENQYAQDILLLTHMYQKNLNKLTGEYGSVYYRGCNFEDVKDALYPYRNHKLPKNSFVQFLVNSQFMSEDVKEKLVKAGIEAKVRMRLLFGEMNKHKDDEN